MSASAGSVAQGVIYNDHPYWQTVDITCFVEKAVPAPEKGSTWYTTSPIGDVRFKFAATTQPTEKTTIGVITLYRRDNVYQELAVYENAWLQNVGDAYEGSAEFAIPLDPDSEHNPYFFSIDKVESQGLFNGKDGRPKYFLSECSMQPALARVSESLLDSYNQHKASRK